MTTNTSDESAIILLGGGVVDSTSIGTLPKPARVIAADSGAELADILGLTVDTVVGDLDSLNVTALRALTALGTTIVRHPADKNETDAELAILHALEQGARHLTIIGAWGGRIDHQMSIVALLFHDRLSKIHVEARFGSGRVFPIRSGQSRTIDCPPDAVVGLIPFGGDVHNIRTDGLHWPLHDETLPIVSSRGVSNRCTHGSFTVSVGAGLLLATVHAPETAHSVVE